MTVKSVAVERAFTVVMVVIVVMIVVTVGTLVIVVRMTRGVTMPVCPRGWHTVMGMIAIRRAPWETVLRVPGTETSRRSMVPLLEVERSAGWYGNFLAIESGRVEDESTMVEQLVRLDFDVQAVVRNPLTNWDRNWFLFLHRSWFVLVNYFFLLLLLLLVVFLFLLNGVLLRCSLDRSIFFFLLLSAIAVFFPFMLVVHANGCVLIGIPKAVRFLIVLLTSAIVTIGLIVTVVRFCRFFTVDVLQLAGNWSWLRGDLSNIRLILEHRRWFPFTGFGCCGYLGL